MQCLCSAATIHVFLNYFSLFMFSYSFNIQNLVPSCLTMLQLQCRWQKPNIHDINSSLSANKGQKLVKHGHNSHFGRQTNSWCLKKRRSKGEPWCLEWKWRVMTHKNVAHDAYYICTTCGSQCQLAGFSIFAEKIWSNRKKMKRDTIDICTVIFVQWRRQHMLQRRGTRGEKPLWDKTEESKSYFQSNCWFQFHRATS